MHILFLVTILASSFATIASDTMPRYTSAIDCATPQHRPAAPSKTADPATPDTFYDRDATGRNPISSPIDHWTAQDRQNSGSPENPIASFCSPEQAQQITPSPLYFATIARFHKEIEEKKQAAQQALLNRSITAITQHQEALLTAFINMMNTTEPMARQEIESQYEQITKSMGKKQHRINGVEACESEQRVITCALETTAFAKLLKKADDSHLKARTGIIFLSPQEWEAYQTSLGKK